MSARYIDKLNLALTEPSEVLQESRRNVPKSTLSWNSTFFISLVQ